MPDNTSAGLQNAIFFLELDLFKWRWPNGWVVSHVLLLHTLLLPYLKMLHISKVNTPRWQIHTSTCKHIETTTSTTDVCPVKMVCASTTRASLCVPLMFHKQMVWNQHHCNRFSTLLIRKLPTLSSAQNKNQNNKNNNKKEEEKETSTMQKPWIRMDKKAHTKWATSMLTHTSWTNLIKTSAVYI